MERSTVEKLEIAARARMAWAVAVNNLNLERLANPPLTASAEMAMIIRFDVAMGWGAKWAARERELQALNLEEFAASLEKKSRKWGNTCGSMNDMGPCETVIKNHHIPEWGESQEA